MKKKRIPIQPIVLFDGVCNFCNNTINFVIKRDRKNTLRFTTLQSFPANQLLEQYGLSGSGMQSFVFIENGKAYTKSTAALRVCKYLTLFWPLVYAFIIVPRFIRDGVYDYIASNRYKWFGSKEECMVPNAAVKRKFLY
jgi:predicted DCC family thiol-disulfide oxidoreductase YuxK